MDNTVRKTTSRIQVFKECGPNSDQMERSFLAAEWIELSLGPKTTMLYDHRYYEVFTLVNIPDHFVMEEDVLRRTILVTR